MKLSATAAGAADRLLEAGLLAYVVTPLAATHGETRTSTRTFTVTFTGSTPRINSCPFFHSPLFFAMRAQSPCCNLPFLCVCSLSHARHLAIVLKPPPPSPSTYRGAALAARVGPAAAGVRKGVLSRVPGFGIRTLMRHRSESAAGAGGGESSEEAEGDDGKDVGPRKELEEATKALLLGVGGEYRQDTVLAAAVGNGTKDGAGPAVGSRAWWGSWSWTGERKAEAEPQVEADVEGGRWEGRNEIGLEEEEEGGGAGGEDRGAREARIQGDVEEVNGRGDLTSKVGQEGWMGDGGKEERQRVEEAEPEAAVTTAEAPYAASAAGVSTIATEAGTATGPTNDAPLVESLASEAVPIDRGSRSEEVRGRRAEIKRRRAALREQEQRVAAASPSGVSAVESLRRKLRRRRTEAGRRRSKKNWNSPEQEDMIRRVCALSRPPPGGA